MCVCVCARARVFVFVCVCVCEVLSSGTQTSVTGKFDIFRKFDIYREVRHVRHLPGRFTSRARERAPRESERERA